MRNLVKGKKRKGYFVQETFDYRKIVQTIFVREP
jgi:hypothetical protein